MSPDRLIAQMAASQFGIITRAQAMSAGLSTDQIEYRLTVGRWLHVHRGIYRIAGTPSSKDGDLYAALLGLGPQAVASVCTAAAHWGLMKQDHCRVLHVSVPDRSQPALRGVQVHRPRELTRRDITSMAGIRLTTPDSTLLDLSWHLPEIELENAVDEATRRRLVKPALLLRRVERERRPGKKGMSVLAELLRERTYPDASGSPGEARFLRLLRAAGLPSPEREVSISDQGRFIARVDFAYPKERVAIEVDGYAYHGGREPWERDHEQLVRLVDAGWLVFPFTVRAINERPDEIVASVRQALRRRKSGGRQPQ